MRILGFCLRRPRWAIFLLAIWIYGDLYWIILERWTHGIHLYLPFFIFLSIKSVPFLIIYSLISDTWNIQALNYRYVYYRIVYNRYIYSGSVTLTTDSVLPILLLADKYCIRKLCQSCVHYMLRHIVESPDTNRTLSWYQYAKMTGCTELQENCLRFILSNFHIVQVLVQDITPFVTMTLSQNIVYWSQGTVPKFWNLLYEFSATITKHFVWSYVACI